MVKGGILPSVRDAIYKRVLNFTVGFWSGLGKNLYTVMGSGERPRGLGNIGRASATKTGRGSLLVCYCCSCCPYAARQFHNHKLFLSPDLLNLHENVLGNPLLPLLKTRSSNGWEAVCSLSFCESSSRTALLL